MSVLAWIGTVVLAWLVVGLVVVMVRERSARGAVAEFLLALVVGPVLLTVGVFLRHRAPRAVPLTAEALERFARCQSGHTGLGKRERSAWLLAYRGRGVIVVRNRHDNGWLNDVPNRASRVRRETADAQARQGGAS